MHRSFRDRIVSARFINGSTLLHTACYFKNFQAVKRLLQLGVSPDVRDYQGKTPLHRTQDIQILQVCQLIFFICLIFSCENSFSLNQMPMSTQRIMMVIHHYIQNVRAN